MTKVYWISGKPQLTKSYDFLNWNCLKVFTWTINYYYINFFIIIILLCSILLHLEDYSTSYSHISPIAKYDSVEKKSDWRLLSLNCKRQQKRFIHTFIYHLSFTLPLSHQCSFPGGSPIRVPNHAQCCSTSEYRIRPHGDASLADYTIIR